MSGLVDGHKGNVTRTVSGGPDVSGLGLVGGDERGGRRVQKGGLVSRLELVDPVLRACRRPISRGSRSRCST